MQPTYCICAMKSCSPIDPLARALENFLQSDHPHLKSPVVSKVIASILRRLADVAQSHADLAEFRDKGLAE